MTTIIVQGRQVPVSDSFFRLSPEEQDDTIREIIQRMTREAENGQPSANAAAKTDRELSVGEYAEDVAKSFGVGLAKGGIGLAGTGGDIREGVSGASNWLAEKLGASPENAKWFADRVREGVAANPVFPVLSGPTSPQITDVVREATRPAPTVTQLVTGERPQSFIDRQPRSTLGEYSQTFGEFAPAALAGPGGAIRKTAMTVLPAVLSETAGQVARATGHEEYEPWARLGGAVFGGGLAAGGRSNTVRNVAFSSKSPMMYNPIPKPQRAFAQDYSKEAIGNATGRLKKDIEGRPLTAPKIAGRRMVGEPDSRLTTAEVRSIGEETVREGIKGVAPGNLRGTAGLATFDKYSGAPISIKISKGQTSSQGEKTLAHEVAHVIHKLVGNIPTKGIERELDFIYNALNTGRERIRHLTRPEHIGYTVAEAPDERIAEAIRAYWADPNWIKTVAPKTAARLREYVNSHPVVSRIVQLNGLAAGAGGGLALAAQSDDSNAAELSRQRGPQVSLLKGTYSNFGSSIPFALIDGATKAGVHGLSELKKALLRRGLYTRPPRSKELRDLVRTLVDLKVQQKSQFYGGPR